jgi:hypothetical protein
MPDLPCLLQDLYRWKQLHHLQQRILLGHHRWRTLCDLSDWLRLLRHHLCLLQLPIWVLSVPKQLFGLSSLLLQLFRRVHLHFLHPRHTRLESLCPLHGDYLPRLSWLHILRLYKQLHQLHWVRGHLLPGHKRGLPALFCLHNWGRTLQHCEHSDSMPIRLRCYSFQQVLFGGDHLHQEHQKL